MDAASMTFEDNAFNNIICVEAAFHFNTRESFFRNTLRILKRGGMLALTDVLLHEEGHAILPMWLRCNFMPSLSAYGEMLYQIGFSQVSVVDISEEGWKSFARFHCATLHDDWIAGKCEFAELQRSLVTLYRLKAAIKHNLMCIAIK
jgi:ubiquinone/menaquinone biosynthesis C-methylase UbiE